jgi:hypothetical protein
MEILNKTFLYFIFFFKQEFFFKDESSFFRCILTGGPERMAHFIFGEFLTQL